MKTESITFAVGVLVIISIILISDTNLIGRIIYKQPDIVWIDGSAIYCNQYECEDACGRQCGEYKNNHKQPICSHKIYYDRETDESWYMYYKCE